MKIYNRKATYNYHILKELSAGIQLLGSEVKSLRYGKADISEAFIYIHNNECFIKNMYISKYMESSYMNHEELRDRKLLLNKKEILSLKDSLKGNNSTILPLEIFLMKGLFKVKIALATGKKNYDKRESIKEKDIQRKLQRKDYD